MKKRDLYHMYYSNVINGLLANKNNAISRAIEEDDAFGAKAITRFIDDADFIMEQLWPAVLEIGDFDDEEGNDE